MSVCWVYAHIHSGCFYTYTGNHFIRSIPPHCQTIHLSAIHETMGCPCITSGSECVCCFAGYSSICWLRGIYFFFCICFVCPCLDWPQRLCGILRMIPVLIIIITSLWTFCFTRKFIQQEKDHKMAVCMFFQQLLIKLN